MVTRDEIEKSPGGITYLTSGQLKRHLYELASQLEGVSDSKLVGATEEEFRVAVLARLAQCEADVAELFSGINFLYETLRNGGILRAG